MMVIYENIFTARKRSCGKVMFSQASVRSQRRVGISYAISWDRSHGRVPPSLTWTSDLGTYPCFSPPPSLPSSPCPLPLPCPPPDIRPGNLPLLPATDIWWLSLETCSNVFTRRPMPSPYWYWHLVVATKTCKVGKYHTGMLSCFLSFLIVHYHFFNLCGVISIIKKIAL